MGLLAGIIGILGTFIIPGTLLWMQLGVITLGVVYLGIADVWSQRRAPTFWWGVCTVLLLHSIFCIYLWHRLPLHFVVVLIIGAIESVPATLIMYKFVGVPKDD
jgi:hypothetical protein